MANIIIAGSSIVLKSDVTLEAVKKLAKYRPAALEERDEKERLLFKVSVAGTGNGSVQEKAVYFAPITHDADGLATVTLEIPDSVKNAVDYAADLLAPAFTALSEMEDAIIGASDEVDAAKAAMIENIAVL